MLPHAWFKERFQWLSWWTAPIVQILHTAYAWTPVVYHVSKGICQATDGGIAASVDILNPNRKRIWVNSMWYSFSYWSSVESIYSDTRFTDDQKKAHGIPNLSDVPKTNYYCTTQISSILPSQYNKSNVPIWFMNLSEASTARLKGIICSSNYGLVLNLSTWFCISPLLIYDLRLKKLCYLM